MFTTPSDPTNLFQEFPTIVSVHSSLCPFVSRCSCLPLLPGGKVGSQIDVCGKNRRQCTALCTYVITTGTVVALVGYNSATLHYPPRKNILFVLIIHNSLKHFIPCYLQDIARVPLMIYISSGETHYPLNAHGQLHVSDYLS